MKIGFAIVNMVSQRRQRGEATNGPGQDTTALQSARPARRVRRTNSGQFVSLAEAISDSDEGTSPELALHSRKRKRTAATTSYSVPLLLGPVNSPSGEITCATPTVARWMGTGRERLLLTTVDIPPYHQGPLQLQLKLYPSSSWSPPLDTLLLPLAPPKSNCCFFKLPRELRDEIYSLIYARPPFLRFDNPGYPLNLCFGTALLRTCSQIHTEATEVLYGTNYFVFGYQHREHGSYWAPDWEYVGWKAVRTFVTSIGTRNLDLIKRMTFILVDGSTSWLQARRTKKKDKKRFVDDKVLQFILRFLGKRARLEWLGIHCSGEAAARNCVLVVALISLL